MAMLAEKKRRQRWCINPRGKHWSDDQTKFGQRILEKMGWSAGQGLGINKQGPTDIVKVKKKDDSAGLGFKENGERWLETANEYNELLDQLTSTGESEKDQADVSSSLEDRSKKSKARVHYHKFTRGKDLSRYSAKDLASIIGPDLVKCKSVDDIKDDYKANQINKGSLTEYFNGKKKAKHKQSPESEPTINEDTTNEEQAGCLDKRHKTSKQLKEVDAENPECEVNKSNKKSKKNKSDEEQVADYLYFNDEDLNNRNILKNKNKSLQNGLEVETIEQMNELKVSSSNSCTDGGRIFKANKKGNKIKGENCIELVVHNSIANPCEEELEKDVLCEKLPKRKKKKVLINGEINTITNEILSENKSDVKTVPFEFEHNCDESNTNSKKDAKRKKKEKKLKNAVPTTPIDNSISNYDETYEDNLTYKLPNTNIQNLENNCKSNVDFANKSEVKEENLVSKKKKKNKQHLHVNDYVEKLEMVENKNFESKLSKKRKSGNKDTTVIDDFKNSCIKRKKGKEEHIGSLHHEEPYSVVFSTELEKEPLREEQLPKHSKKRNKSKDQNTLDSEVKETLITSIEDPISSCNKNYKDNLTDKLSKNNLQQSEKDCTSDFVNESGVNEENLTSKKKKNKHAVHDNDSVKKLETFENKNFEKKVSRKRKSEDKDKAILDPENNNYIKRKKDKKENIDSLTNDEPSSVLNPELEKGPSKEEQLPKKKRNKSKDQSNLDREVNADLDEPEKLLNIKEENKFLHETTSINNNEDITSKPSGGCLTVFGRQTRLKNFDITRNPTNPKQIVTEEYMAFSESKNVTSIKSKVCENVESGENSSYHRIYVEPSDEDSNITMNIANYEYRLLTSKIKQLNIPTDVVKIIIKNNVPLPQKLRKKLKLLYKSKYLKSLLPEDELTIIKTSVKECAVKLQPKVDVIKGLLEIENQTVKLANETHESGMVADSNKKQTEKDNLTPEKKETLKGMKKQLKLLSKVGKETTNATSRNSEESTDKERTKTAPNSKCDYKNEKNSRGGAFKEVSVPVSSLQTRIEERLKVLGEQMKQLSEGRKLLPDINNSFSNERKSTSSRDKVNQGWYNQESDSVRTKNGSGHPIYGRSGCGASSRSQGTRSSWGMGYGLRQGGALRERGVKTVLKGRISKNNFDAKQYAMKCKVEKILPEIAFKGVDLKVISGYAANDNEQPAIGPSSHSTTS